MCHTLVQCLNNRVTSASRTALPFCHTSMARVQSMCVQVIIAVVKFDCTCNQIQRCRTFWSQCHCWLGILTCMPKHGVAARLAYKHQCRSESDVGTYVLTACSKRCVLALPIASVRIRTHISITTFSNLRASYITVAINLAITMLGMSMFVLKTFPTCSAVFHCRSWCAIYPNIVLTHHALVSNTHSCLPATLTAAAAMVDVGCALCPLAATVAAANMGLTTFKFCGGSARGCFPMQPRGNIGLQLALVLCH